MIAYGGNKRGRALCIAIGIILLGLLIAGGAGAVPVEQWNKTFGGTVNYSAISVKQTSDGGYIFLGSNLDKGDYGYNAWLIKTDTYGDQQWNKTFEGMGANSVQQTSDGGYVIVGATYIYGAGLRDAWLIKTDANGNQQWNKTFGGTEDEWGYSVQQTFDGGYILAGYGWITKTDADGNEQWNKTFTESVAVYVQQTVDEGYILTGTTFLYGGTDAWLVKTSANGTEKWNKTFGSAEWSNSWSVQQTSDGGYILAGAIESNGTSRDAWLIRTDANGNHLWNKTFGGTISDTAYFAQQTSDGGYVLIGDTHSIGAGWDGWIIKTDANGYLQWTKTFGGIGIRNVQQTSDNGYILAGTSSYYEASHIDAWLIKVSSEVTENKNPDQPTVLKQLKSDEKTQINIGEIAGRSKVVFSAKVSDQDNDKVKLQVELRRLDEYGGNFDETKGGLKESGFVASGNTVTTYAVDLIDGSYHWRARTIDEHGNKSEWVSFGGNPDSSADFIVRGFRFVQLSDTHIGPDPDCFDYTRYPENQNDDTRRLNCLSNSHIGSYKVFKNVTESITKLDPKPDFVLITGDLVEWNQKNQYQLFTQVINKFGNILVYTVPGNHDRRGSEDPTEMVPDLLGTVYPQNNLDNYKNYLGGKVINGVQGDYSKGNYYFNNLNYRFIGLDSGYDPSLDEVALNPGLKQAPTGSGLSQQQIDIIKNKAIYGKTFIFMHHPAMDYDNSLNVISENREQFVNLVKEKNVKSVLTGHSHYSKFFKTTGPTRFVQTRSATKDTYDDGGILVSLRGYLIVDVGKDITDINKIQLQDVQMSGAQSETVTTITIFSPADLHVYDEFGRHTGLNASGGIETKIPDTYYLKESKMGNITLPASVLLYNNTLNYSFKIVSNFSKENVTGEQSSFNFTIEQRTGDTIKTINYNNVSINRNSMAYLKLNTTQANYAMQVDLNNDSIMDATKSPDTIITDYAPTVAILSPTNGSIRDQGQPITFNGKGIDIEDGILAKLTWISDRDDVIGHGNFTTSNLSAGIHQITLLVKDTAGQVNTSNLILTIKDTKAPVLDIQYPTINKIFNKQDIAVRGIASDDSGISNVTVNGIQAGKEDWNTVLTLNEGENKIEVVATDNKGFTTTTNRTVYYNSSLASDTQPPAPITNLTNKTGYDNLTGAWINWTWDNPKDQDFSYAIVYLDNIPMGNTSKSYFNFTGLSSDADYNVSILTADIVDNINQMWVNASARTATSASTPTPIVGTKGDVNGDGQVSIVDALFIAQYTVGTKTLTSTQLAAADVNGDGQVTIVDALFIAQYTVGLRQL